MAQELPVNVRVVRLFGADQHTVDEMLRTAHDKQQVQTQSMHKGAETLVVLQALSEDAKGNRIALDRWDRRLRAACGGAVYGTGDTSLTQATVQALQKAKKLFVCADAETGTAMEQRMEAVENADSVYDFGGQSYAHEKLGRKIEAAGSKRKLADKPLKQAVARVQQAYQLSGADWAVAFAALETGENWLVMGEKKGYWLRLIPAGENPALWLLDMLRRDALSTNQAPGTEWLRYKDRTPETDQMHAAASTAVAEGLAQGAWEQSTHKMKLVDPDEPELPPRQVKGGRGRRRALIALALVLVLALVAVAVLWLYTGGDIAGFLNKSGISGFSVSNADMV
ncbi:MAG: hypothetical protein IJ347_09340 [Faecalibacterium sp.]|nr:hypothetical protein [Faecalibacterium sp.]